MLVKLAAQARTDKVLFGQVRFVDIAGIIKGASAGAGLGNKFLQNIKDVDVLLHVVRCFEDPQVIHVDSTIDPLHDMEVIETELLLADMQTIEKRMENADKAVRAAAQADGRVVNGRRHRWLVVCSHVRLFLLLCSCSQKKKEASAGPLDRKAFYAKCRSALDAGVALVDVDWESAAERDELDAIQLITAKPMAYVCNVDEKSTQKHNQFTEKVFKHVEDMNQAKRQTARADGDDARGRVSEPPHASALPSLVLACPCPLCQPTPSRVACA